MVGFPLLLIPLAVYNLIVFLMPSVSFTDVLFKVPMMAGREWPVNLSDLLLALGIVLLLLEIIKGARPGAKYLMDHLLSLIVFGAAAAQFVMWEKFGNSTYFLLTLLAMVDFFGGVAQRRRRRLVVTEVAPVPPRSSAPKSNSSKASRQVEEPTVAPASEPAQRSAPTPQAGPVAEPTVSAQPMAEPVSTDHPATPSVQAPAGPSAEIPSQLSQSNPTSPETPSH